MTTQPTAEAEAAISEQITRAILGTRRPELIVDPFAPLVSTLQRMAEQLAPVLQRFDAAMTAAGKRMADAAEDYLRTSPTSGRDGNAT